MTLSFVGCWLSAAGLLGVGTVVDDEDVSALPFTIYFTTGPCVQCIVVACSDSSPIITTVLTASGIMSGDKVEEKKRQISEWLDVYANLTNPFVQAAEE